MDLAYSIPMHGKVDRKVRRLSLGKGMLHIAISKKTVTQTLRTNNPDMV